MEKIMDNEAETGENMGIKELNSSCIFSFAGVKFMPAKSPAVLLHASRRSVTLLASCAAAVLIWKFP